LIDPFKDWSPLLGPASADLLDHGPGLEVGVAGGVADEGGAGAAGVLDRDGRLLAQVVVSVAEAGGNEFLHLLVTSLVVWCPRRRFRRAELAWEPVWARCSRCPGARSRRSQS